MRGKILGLWVILLMIAFVMSLLTSTTAAKSLGKHPDYPVWPKGTLWGAKLTIENSTIPSFCDIFWGVKVGPEYTDEAPPLPPVASWVRAVTPQAGADYAVIVRMQDNTPQSYSWYVRLYASSGIPDGVLKWELENATHWFVPPDFSVVLENMSQNPIYGYDNVSLNLRQLDNYPVNFRGISGVVTYPWYATLYVDNAVNVSILPGYQENEVGGQLTYTVTVNNTGRYDDIYTLIASDDLGWDLTLSDNLLMVPAGGGDDVEITVSVESRATDLVTVAAVGAYASDSNHVEAKGVAPSLPGVSVSVSPDENEVAPGSTTFFTVTVTNEGEVADDYDLLVTDNAGWGAVLDDSELTIPAAESRQTTLSVTVPSEATESESTEITVIATSQAHPTVEDSAKCLIMVGEGEAPSLGFPWLPVVAVVIVLIVIIGVILVLRPF